MKEYKINFGGNNNSPKQKGFWTKVIVMTLAIWITCLIFPSIVTGDILGALLAAIIISLLNSFLRPLLTMIFIPLIVVTFGFFYVVINVIIVLLTAALLPNFSVNGFWGAVGFIIIVSAVSWLLDMPARYNRKNEPKQEKEPEFTNYEDVSNDNDNDKKD
ncbi:MAG: phage holin family protein [Bacteroidales bacterium]|jgi:putative membrane protein|nr:phage holin family protein [Bacteroidales bacterium]